MIRESLEQRVKWLHPELCEYVREGVGVFRIQETRQEGLADIVCRVRRPSILFHKLDGHTCTFLRNQRCADAIIFEKTSEEAWTLHIVECTRTMKEDTWTGKVKIQFEGAILNAQALMGILNISKLDDVRCYTAFRNDRISPFATPNPVLLKAGVGTSERSLPSIEWEEDRIRSLLSLRDIRHTKVRLDPNTGHGEISIE